AAQRYDSSSYAYDDPPPPPPPVGGYGEVHARPDPAYGPGDGQVSDWEGAEHAPPGRDPRIGRPNRSPEIGGIGALLTACAAVAPLVGFGLLVLLGAVARTADRSVTSLLLRRTERGVRRSDVPMAVAASPLHFIIGLLASAIFALVPLIVAGGVMFAVAFGISLYGDGVIEPIRPLPLAVGALAGVVAAWWGPGGASLRRGTRSLVRGLTPSVTGRQIFGVVVSVLIVAVVAWLVTTGALQPTWWPLSGPPQLP
ncbi:MAG: hypothetical protein Q4G67_03855, partial [Actinomycetia bacterium]|nr:hypothetical protein [Actinomycetes bacterium]